MTAIRETHRNGFHSVRSTRILSVNPSKILKTVSARNGDSSFPNDWDFELDEETIDGHNLQDAAHSLRESDFPVAFPTETVYGLGADATRSQAVRGIYKAKQRPADNPLIVHVSSLNQLRQLLQPSIQQSVSNSTTHDLIPEIYKPLIQKHWPGPLTILLPNPDNSRLAPEVTAGLNTFGARMPKNLLALVLIKLAGVPLAAPSANASTKPSPTAAEHVHDDLSGRIDFILDGGPCDVGVESTVVDGLSTPPSILRPGGISAKQLRQCPGWENVVIGYKDSSEKGLAPRAPGMKYRHYSPKARVILYTADKPQPSVKNVLEKFGAGKSIGFIHTRKWKPLVQSTAASATNGAKTENTPIESPNVSIQNKGNSSFDRLIQSVTPHAAFDVRCSSGKFPDWPGAVDAWEISLGKDTESIARGLFSALRSLDKQGVDIILVEGIDEHEGDTAAAIMNRLRKAAEVEIQD